MHDPPHARLRGGADRHGGTLDVGAQHRGRILDAERVLSRDVEERGAALHAAGEDVGVEDVAAHDARPAALELAPRGVRARQGDHLVAALAQGVDERAADHAAAPADEDAAHGSERSTAAKRSR